MGSFIPQYYFDAVKKIQFEELLRRQGFSEEEIASMVHLLEPVPTLVSLDDDEEQET